MSEFWDALRRHRQALLLLLSSLLIPMLTDLVTSWLSLSAPPSQLLRMIGFGLALALGLGALYVALCRHRPPTLVPQEEQPPRFAGLIVLVGPGRGDALQQSAVPAM